MKQFLFYLLEKYYAQEFKEWKQKELESDRVVLEFYYKYFSYKHES